MKESLKSLAIVIVILLSTSRCLLLAQENFHNGRYFLKMNKARLITKLEKLNARQEQENITVKRLISKNDSLLSEGNIYDSVSRDISEQLMSHQKHIDSMSKTITAWKQKLYKIRSFHRYYTNVHSAIDETYSETRVSEPRNEIFFKRINDKLDSSNLSGEKGRLKGMLNSAAAQQEKEAAKLEEIDNKKDNMLNSGLVDSSVAFKIDNRMQVYKQRMDSIKGEIITLGQKLNSPKDFTKDFTLIKKKIILIDSIVNKNAASREFIFTMIDEGLSKSTRNLFKLAAFFGPGGFIIPKDKYDMAKRYFSPVIDSLVKFSNTYSTVLRTATIIVNGYADASSISSGQKLYKTLSGYLNNPKPVKEALNAALSALRAEEISKFLTSILKERYPDFQTIDKIVFEAVEVGKGEILPDTAITNYKVNDDRRRVVIIYWSILPIE